MTTFFFGEIRNLTTFTRLMDYNNGFSLSSLSSHGLYLKLMFTVKRSPHAGTREKRIKKKKD